MALFDHRVDVGGELKAIWKIVNHRWDKTALEIRSRAQRILYFLRWYYNHYGDGMQKEKGHLFFSMISQVDMLSKAQTFADAHRNLNAITAHYNDYCAMAPTYLYRHPEKDNPDQIGASATGRELSFRGVTQAKRISEDIISEILATDRSVVLIISHSYYKRTKLFAEIIRKQVESMVRHHGKECEVARGADALISGDIIKDCADLGEWSKSKNSKDVGKSGKRWFNTRTSMPDTYTINVGITHIPNLIGFLHHELGLSVKFCVAFPVAGCVKLENKAYSVLGKWLD